MVEKHTSSVIVHRNGQAKRAQIIEAAHRHFSYYGFSKVTMNEIAAELGMGKASLYYYFLTKEDLFQAVLAEKHKEFLMVVECRLGSLRTSTEKARTFVAMRMDFFSEILNLNIVDFQHWQSIRPQLQAAFKTFTQHEQQILRRIIHEGSDGGEFDIESVEKCTNALFQIMRGMRCQFIRTIEGPQFQKSDFQVLKRETLFIIDLFLRGMSRHGGRMK